MNNLEKPKSEKQLDTNQWAMLLHFSQLAGFILPIAGLAAPIIIWQLKKEEFPALDEHGKIVANWIISELIYAAVSSLLIFMIIGIPLLAALGILSVVFPIIGGIKANNGEAWKYPLTIDLIK